MRNIRADIVKKALSKKHGDDFFLTEVKNGPTQVRTGELLILDAVAVKKSWANPCITGYEVKVDKADFLRDEKWPAYMQYCHRFSFVCPNGLIQPEELPKEVGLIWYNKEKDSLYTKRKSVFRPIEIDANFLWYIIICRLKSDRHPFFSTDREYFEAWVEDRVERRRIGSWAGSKMEKELAKALEAKDKAEKKAENLQEYSNKLNEIKQIAYAAGISSWDLVEGIRKALNGGAVTPDVAIRLNNIVREVDMIRKNLGGTQP